MLRNIMRKYNLVAPERPFLGREGKKWQPDKKSKKKGIFDGLKRSDKDRMLAGVCAGIANYLDWDVSIIRILLIVIILAGGIGVPLYVILWVLMPLEEEE